MTNVIGDRIDPCLLESSRCSLLSELIGGSSLVFFRTQGNTGDKLIHAGVRQLLKGVAYREADIRHAAAYTGDIAIISGGGGWCKVWRELPLIVRMIERAFVKVVVLPSSFDTAEPLVESWLRTSKARVFVREPESLRQVSAIRPAMLALDCAFFFNYEPYANVGYGNLNAFRTDREKRLHGLPQDNIDISLKCTDLDQWLHTIAAFESVATDRAHVTIAAALLGKYVRYSESSYHKVCGIAQYALRRCRTAWEEPQFWGERQLPLTHS